jgi:hypothetical protein
MARGWGQWLQVACLDTAAAVLRIIPSFPSGRGVTTLIGEAYPGVLGSDFYGGYNIHQGLPQRCWIHFLRDVHELKEQPPHDEGLLSWATALHAIYDQAVVWSHQEGP